MLQSTIGDLPFVERYLHFEGIDSTNTYAKSLDTWPSQGMIVIHADRQSAGRGQRGNTFYSDTTGGVWASIVVRPQSISYHFSHNRAMVLAIFDAVARRVDRAPLGIKWPNDLYWGDRKLCGLLLETAGPANQFLVIGFGINVNILSHQFPPELQGSATSILIETGKETAIRGLLRDILNRYRTWMAVAESAAHEEYRSRLLGRGRGVAVGGMSGLFEDVLEDGRLRMTCATGTEHLSSGPLRFVP